MERITGLCQCRGCRTALAQAIAGVVLVQCAEHGRIFVGIADLVCWLSETRSDGVELLITCGGCGEAIPIAAVQVLPGNPPEARCSRCMGEEARS